MSIARFQANGTLPAIDPGMIADPVSAPVFALQEIETLAESVAKSRLFPGIATKEAAVALMMLCQAEGLHPMQAVRRYHIIEGRPSMRADAMQAEFQRHNGRIQWLRTDAEACEATFFHPTHAPDGVQVRFTIEEARNAGLANRSVWKSYAPAMLRARVISIGVRMILPGVICGIYTPEEIEEVELPAIPQTAAPAAFVAQPQAPAGKVVAADPLRLRAQRADGYDPRPYHEIVRDEVAELQGIAHRDKLGEWPMKAPQVHQHLLKAAVAAGHAEKPEGSLKLSEVITRVNAIYETQREWLRDELFIYTQDALILLRSTDDAGEDVVIDEPGSQG